MAAEDKQVSAASRRRARLSGWVLSQFQVTLLLCGMVVGFLVCFGLGFLSGVWFQTQEQMMPHDDAITLADDQLERERKTLSQSRSPSPSPSREMTFYSALTSSDGTPESKPKPKEQHVADPSAAEAPSARPGEADKVEPDRAKQTDSARLMAAQSPDEPPEAASSAPKPKREIPTASAGVSPERFYSVQVGSFRKVEQAYRLQDQLIKKGYQARIGLSIVEGKGAWYRVRVGRYADRGTANKTAQRLQNREKIDVLVMRVSS
ncbi:MAG: hypothetical protein ETSY1_13575 [Candidatus Entotheonella factor]|uniref:SPOR domain-containing protein n=1 Tax=Entotheonella factor TaxID=1429438 RepID=W4LQ27_ENTF1|nr:SPOR domain-containing protein [Candidatus Entotheonella palauensis]ETW99815.1 MAG: hypothetical protein ETSY1_13575 [Candidatus Entotheonella factor]